MMAIKFTIRKMSGPLKPKGGGAVRKKSPKWKFKFLPGLPGSAMVLSASSAALPVWGECPFFPNNSFP